jgi:methyl-accepting chemotaxis protein
MENLYTISLIYGIVITIILIASFIIYITLLSKKITKFKTDLMVSERIIGDLKQKLSDFYKEFSKNYKELNNSAYCINTMLKEIRKKIDKFIENYNLDYDPNDNDATLEIIGRKYDLKNTDKIFKNTKDDYIYMNEIKNMDGDKSNETNK